MSRRCRLIHVICVTACALMIASILRHGDLRSSNDTSRWLTVGALVEDGTYRIDAMMQRTGWHSVDVFVRNGSTYSTKPPLLSTIVAGEYGVLRGLGLSLEDNPKTVICAILLTTNGSLYVVWLLLLWRTLDRIARREWTRSFVFAAGAFGTLLTPFVVSLNNHLPAAVLVLGSVYVFLGIRDDGRPHRYAIAGICVGLAASIDLLSAVFAIALAMLFAKVSWKTTLARFVPSALAVAAVSTVLNVLAVGSAIPYQVQRPPHVRAPRLTAGIDQLHESKLTYAFHSTFGHHGIFSLTPIFLIAIAGIVSALRKPERDDAWRLALATMLSSIGVLAFYLSRTHNYGGVSAGFRWVIWLTPLWLVQIVPAMDSWAASRRGRAIGAGALCVSIFSALFPLENPWASNWLERLLDGAQWLGYRT